MGDASLYAVIETLYRGDETCLYRATSRSDHRSVILKVLDPRHSLPHDLERLKNEYEIGKSLDTPAVIRSLALETYQGQPALVLEDFGGQSLDRLLGAPLPLERFLSLAVRIASAVAELHRLGIIHKNLKPQNILVHPTTSEVKLADLGLASRLPGEPQPAQPPGRIEGSLPYLSPEQTGRMNRSLDSRTDLYSLGVTFYEMLTGRLPFEVGDPLEWVHCHVARTPQPPSALVPGLPEILSALVMRLLAKMAEERYQTASGLEHDLERCLVEWRSTGALAPFPLAEHDVSRRFQIPQKLYGRKDEIAALLDAFERVVDAGVPEIVLVSGYSGIGKSALVHELQKPIVRERGFFISGKFDQYKRDIPYSTIAQAFQGLVLEILAESEERLRAWKERLLAALGVNAQLIVDVIPPVELVIGRPPPVLDLPPTEAQNRFRIVFGQFIGVFARREHPLALFLDDLQWADSASLALLQDLMTRPETRHLLVIGAYRDNEVAPSHPLMLTLGELRKAGTRVSGIVLGPLSREHLAALVSDTLHCRREDAAPLSDLVHEKTAGNPFFVIQFLIALHEERLIDFDERAETFRWDVARIRAKGFTDNVVDLMIGKLKQLPAATQEALKQLACLGNTAEVAILTMAHGGSEQDTHEGLREAVRAGLVHRLEGTYKFLHDRIHEAAYSLIPEGERAAVHLLIGRLLSSRMASEEIEEKIFEIVNQLDRGARLITSPEERERVAELNLVAGKRAKGSTAYASALKYLSAGAALLSEDSWDRRYELTFALQLHRAECELLTGALEAAEERLSMLSRCARNLVDVAAVACARVALYTILDRSDRSVEVCLEYLRRVGVEWSPHPTDEEVRHEFERIWRQLGDRPIEALIDLPPMTDPDCRATMDVLTSVRPSAMFSDRNLLCLIVGRMASLSLEQGNCDASCLGYIGLGMVLGPFFSDYRAGLRFGQLGFDLVETLGLLRFKARVYLEFGYLINPWIKHMRTSLELLRRAFDAALETGDITYASLTEPIVITLLLAEGDPLGEIQRQAEGALEFARKARFGAVIDTILAHLQLIRTLRGLTPALSSFNDADFDEGRFEQRLEGDPRLSVAACWYWIRKLQGRFHAGEYVSAIEAAAKARPLLWILLSAPELVECNFYGALARAAHYDAASADERPEHMEALVAHHEQLAVWAEICPQNFGNRAALVSAEIARIEGRDLDAERLYEEAIRSAREHGFVHNEAIAYETAARAFRARGFELIADTYLREAHARYLRWGADGKARQLVLRHPGLREARSPAPTATFTLRADQLDLRSVVKASQTISREMVLDDLVHTLLKVVLEQGGAQRGCLVLARDDDLSIEAEATMEENQVVTRILQSLPLDSSALVPASVVKYAGRTGERVILDDASEATRFSSDPYIVRERPKSVLCLPILRQARVVGLLYLENNLLSGAFTPERLAALELLAAQAAISVENALLLSQEKASRANAEEAERRAAFLAEAGVILAESLDYEETLTRLGQLCVRSLCDWCMIDLLEDGQIRRLSGAHADPRKEPLIKELQERYPPRWDSPHAASRSLRSGAPLLLLELSDEAVRSMAADDGHARLIHALGTRAAVVVPLLARGQTLGVLTLASGAPNRYGPQDLKLAEEVARRAAMAIDNARLYRASQEAVRLRDEFLSVASHELYTPITSLTLSLGRILRTPERPPDPRTLIRLVTLASRQGERLTRLVHDLLDVSRIEAGRLPLTAAEVDLCAIAREVVERFESDLARARCTISLQCQAPVPGRWDRSRIDQVITNLLANAIKFGAGKPIEISITGSGDVAQLTVRDYGIGIDPDREARIFERFERGVSERHYGGLGLGLYISRKIVEAHGGSIRVESQPGEGATFTVELPCAGPLSPVS